jgi:hypothetical protein
MQRAATVADYPVEASIARAADSVWETQARSRNRTPRPRTALESLRERATERQNEILRASRRGTQARNRRNARGEGHQQRGKKDTLIAKWADLKWQKQWKAKAGRRRESTWLTPWITPTLPLYNRLTKAEATALFLLRTEVIGLNG